MYRYVKRGIDILLSIIGLIVLSPVFLITAIAIKLDSSGPIFFTQKRAGFKKQSFNMYKFRTMSIDSPTDSPTWMLANANQYITKVGHVIRKISIDELPQLVNILKGDMSIIGPRPVVWAEKELINERYKLGAYKVLPGLTGLAQINGRDLVTTKEKANMDAFYAENIKFTFDLKIFLDTVLYVFRREDVVEGMREKVNTKVEVLKMYETTDSKEESV